jgi:hypothetical protein
VVNFYLLAFAGLSALVSGFCFGLAISGKHEDATILRALQQKDKERMALGDVKAKRREADRAVEEILGIKKEIL